MRYRRLGHSGLRVSEVALGGFFKDGYELSEWSLAQLTGEALERGVNLIDLADIYHQGKVESVYGKLLSSYPRHQLVIATKCFWPMSQGINDRGLSRKHLVESLHGSLKRLNTDYVDLFMCQAEDLETPLEETVRAMSDLIRQGKTLYWGVCGWSVKRLLQLNALCEQLNAPKPIAQQLAYNLFDRYPEREQLSMCAHLGLGVMTWSPFAGGVLAQGEIGGESGGIGLNAQLKRAEQEMLESRYLNANAADSLSRLEAISKEYGLTKAQLSLAWALRRSEVSSVILGVSSLEQLQENLKLYEHSVDAALLSRLDNII